uniref:Uncharacterized protein n=1 Tax=Anguilla anguilla TaxID=7936 RepID=A0A0E9S2W0_ANGAN
MEFANSIPAMQHI